ncbi:MAG: hypothetical protein U5M50_00975 [Sphingobium sp.]|nr:hypothetical protein [Sphingobium sp.]
MRVVLDGGAVIEIGTVEAAPTIGIVDYSRRETDDFGVTTIVPRGFARQMSVRVKIATDQVDYVQRQLAALRATPATWIADDRFASLTIEGFYKDFSIDLAIPPVSYCTLTIEGLAEVSAFVDPGTDPAPDQRASTLRLLQPLEVSNAVLTSASVPENDHGEWSAGVSYALGARVIVAANHRIYESAGAGNIGNDPAGASGLWIDIGPTNRWAMFDQALGTVTSADAVVTVTLAPAQAINAVALLDVIATNVRVQAGGYDRTLAVDAAPGMVTFLDLPMTVGPVTVTITGAGTVSIGTLLIGVLVGLGVTEAAPTAITDYSRGETDDFGETTLVGDAWAKRMNVRSLISTDALDLVAGRIAAVRARPSLWIGDASLECVTVYGFFKDFSIEVGDSVSFLSLSVEGLSKAAQLAPIVPIAPPPSWTDIVDDDPAHPKPADGATVGGTVGVDIYIPEIPDIPAPPGLLRNDLLKLRQDGQLVYRPFGDEEEVELGRIALADIGAVSDGERQRLDNAIDRLGAATVQALAEASKTRETLRDAGVYVDPASGLVRISAIDQTAERVVRRRFASMHCAAKSPSGLPSVMSMAKLRRWRSIQASFRFTKALSFASIMRSSGSVARKRRLSKKPAHLRLTTRACG